MAGYKINIQKSIRFPQANNVRRFHSQKYTYASRNDLYEKGIFFI